MNIQHLLTQENMRTAEQLQQKRLQDLIDFFLERRESIRRFDDFYELVDDPFLRPSIPDAIMRLRQKGTVEILPNGGVKWT